MRSQGLNLVWDWSLKVVSWVKDRSGTWEGLAHGSRLSQAIPTPQLDGSVEDNLDLPHRSLADSSADLSCDSRVNSDYETDGEGYTDGEGHTDGEGGPHTDVDEGPPAPALARSSEPVLADEPQSPKDHGRSSGVRGAQVSRTWGGPSKGLGIGQTHVGSRCSPRTSTETSLIRSASGTWATNQSLTADALTAAPFPYLGYRDRCHESRRRGLARSPRHSPGPARGRWGLDSSNGLPRSRSTWGPRP